MGLGKKDERVIGELRDHYRRVHGARNVVRE